MLAGSGLDHLPDDHAVLPDDGTDGYVESGAFAVRTQAKKYIKTAIGYAAAMAGLYARQLHSKMIVVAFHRVTDEMPGDGITCSSEKLERFCEFFLKHFRVVALSEQIAANRAGRKVGGSLSVTFDDGYRNNYEVAAPILRRLNVPATFL